MPATFGNSQIGPGPFEVGIKADTLSLTSRGSPAGRSDAPDPAGPVSPEDITDDLHDVPGSRSAGDSGDLRYLFEKLVGIPLGEASGYYHRDGGLAHSPCSADFPGIVDAFSIPVIDSIRAVFDGLLLENALDGLFLGVFYEAARGR